MKIGYYPGCSMHATAKDYGESLSGVTQALGVELQEVPDWACCGASSAHVTNHLLGVALPARTLATAEEHGMDRIMTPCAACYGRLCSAAVETGQDPELKREVEEVIGHPLQGSVQVLNIVELLQELLPQVEPLLVRRLEGLKLACYYGCLLLRPHKVTGFDDPEQPESMEALVRAVGAQPVAWNKRVECCGAGFSLARTGSVIRLGRGILDDAAAAGADAVVVACPMCHSNLSPRCRCSTPPRWWGWPWASIPAPWGCSGTSSRPRPWWSGSSPCQARRLQRGWPDGSRRRVRVPLRREHRPHRGLCRSGRCPP